MEANRAKWLGIISVFIIGTLQTLFTLFIIIPLITVNFEAAILACKTIILPYMDFFIPFLFLTCCFFSKKVGEEIILSNKSPFKVARTNLTKILIIAHIFSILIGSYFIKDTIFWSLISEYISTATELSLSLFPLVIFFVLGIVAILVINYLPNIVGAYFLSNFLKQYKS